MKNIERRLARVEARLGACNHHSPVILANPTEIDLEKKRQEIDECSSCRKHGRPKMVVMYCPDLTHEAL